jgi:hypothetical protein
MRARSGRQVQPLALATARYAATLSDAEFGPGAYILTPYNNLAMQMTRNFRNQGLAASRGRKHYGPKSVSTYEDATADFLRSCLGVTNYACFLKARQSDLPLGFRR